MPHLELGRDDKATAGDPTNAFVEALRRWAARKMAGQRVADRAREDQQLGESSTSCDDTDSGGAEPRSEPLGKSFAIRTTVCLDCDTAVEWGELCCCFQGDGAAPRNATSSASEDPVEAPEMPCLSPHAEALDLGQVGVIAPSTYDTPPNLLPQNVETETVPNAGFLNLSTDTESERAVSPASDLEQSHIEYEPGPSEDLQTIKVELEDPDGETVSTTSTPVPSEASKTDSFKIEPELSAQQIDSVPADDGATAFIAQPCLLCLLCPLSPESAADALAQDLLDAHMHDDHGGVAGDAWCGHCARPFRDAATLSAHAARRHGGLQPPELDLSCARCTSCGLCFPDGAAVRAHQEVQHMQVVPLGRLEQLGALLLSLRLGAAPAPAPAERAAAEDLSPGRLQSLCGRCWRRGEYAPRGHEHCPYEKRNGTTATHGRQFGADTITT